MQRTFCFRNTILRNDMELHRRYAGKPLKILISGASGMLGSALVPLLTTGGHEVWRLVRNKADHRKNEMYWSPSRGVIDALAGFDAVIHLAGEYIGLGRWSKAKKKEVFASRMNGTALIARAIAEAKGVRSKGATGFFIRLRHRLLW